MNATPSLDIWEFALAIYSRPGVPVACLALQEAHGVDVPLLIFAAWLAARGVALDAVRADAARRSVAPWHQEIVRALRHVRQRMKAGPFPAPSPETEALRDGVKQVELESERLELTTLAAFAAAWGSGAAIPALANLALMLAVMTGVAQDAPDLAVIAVAAAEVAA